MCLEDWDEINIQKVLLYDVGFDSSMRINDIILDDLIEELQRTVQIHPESQNKTLNISEPVPDVKLRTNQSLLVRILTNMLINAFEASQQNETVAVVLEPSP